MSREIYADKILDSRDIISRMDDLESTLEDAYEEYKDSFDEEYQDYVTNFDGESDDLLEFEDWLSQCQIGVLDFDEWKDKQVNENEEFSEEVEEYNKLKDLEEDCGSREWRYGLTLIRDDYFEEYAQELAEDCGYIARDMQWPYTCIDWSQAAEELKQDYSAVDYDGETYWFRD